MNAHGQFRTQFKVGDKIAVAMLAKLWSKQFYIDRARSTPSMRRPIAVKSFALSIILSILSFNQAASVATLPSALSCERFFRVRAF